MSRLNVFNDSNKDQLGSAYQTKQSPHWRCYWRLGRQGIGQSIQKFSYLPEPVGIQYLQYKQKNLDLLGLVSLYFICFYYYISDTAAKTPTTSLQKAQLLE